MTARLHVTPKTTEQNRTVCTSKSEAEVTNNKKLRSRYCTIDAKKLTTDRHEASRGLSATAELLVELYDVQNTVTLKSTLSQKVSKTAIVLKVVLYALRIRVIGVARCCLRLSGLA